MFAREEKSLNQRISDVFKLLHCLKIKQPVQGGRNSR